jgi:hypothetical protein
MAMHGAIPISTRPVRYSGLSGKQCGGEHEHERRSDNPAKHERQRDHFAITKTLGPALHNEPWPVVETNINIRPIAIGMLVDPTDISASILRHSGCQLAQGNAKSHCGKKSHSVR